MPERGEDFVEPEIVRHPEKLAEVTAQGIGSAGDADVTAN